MGQKHLPIPWARLTYDRALGAYHLDLTEEELKRAPSFAAGEDFDWGDRWIWLDARTRAEFDVRVFAGLLAAGLDRGVDFNCRSAQEKELCPGTPCRYDLRTTRQRLLWSLVP